MGLRVRKENRMKIMIGVCKIMFEVFSYIEVENNGHCGQNVNWDFD